ncbi:MAG TPA: hypothetical protein VKO87_01515 [Gemmatimonadaceae bacterium]|nr:hypothetical protein [Gemmatimonadaceae bacterium]
MKRLLIRNAALAAVLAGCSPFASHHVRPDADVATKPIVQVRTYWRSSVVTIVAWDPDESAIGLRGSVTRTGQIVGGFRFGDHRLYMTPYYVRAMGGFSHAVIAPEHLLAYAGTQRDAYACRYGNDCSPMVTLGVSIPDSFLRNNRDSLVVTFFPTVLDPWTITLRRDLISTYLHAVDSVVTEMKKAMGSERASMANPYPAPAHRSLDRSPSRP